MSEIGCVLLVAVVIAAVIALYVAARLAGERADVKRRQALGEEIHRAFREACRDGTPQHDIAAIIASLQKTRVGYVAPLERWFEITSPALARLVRAPSTAPVVEWYFECFEFPPGKARELLLWLESLIRSRTGIPFDLLLRIVERALRRSGPAETEWLYKRALAELRQNTADREFKSLVLALGRLSYGSKRYDRRLTVYDEQAIANDISVATT